MHISTLFTSLLAAQLANAIAIVGKVNLYVCSSLVFSLSNNAFFAFGEIQFQGMMKAKMY
jgi:hypothetical protein